MNGFWDDWQLRTLLASVVAILSLSLKMKDWLPPKIKGRIEEFQPASDTPGPHQLRLWILVYVAIYNSRAVKTSLKSLTLTVKLRHGDERIIQQDLTFSETYWEQFKPEGQPARRDVFRAAGPLERNVRTEGWVAFPCTIEELDPAKLIVTATDVRSKKFRLAPYAVKSPK